MSWFAPRRRIFAPLFSTPMDAPVTERDVSFCPELEKTMDLRAAYVAERNHRRRLEDQLLERQVACLEGEVKRAQMEKDIERLRRERDAYRKAKQENDERFMGERDEARIEAERLKRERS